MPQFVKIAAVLALIFTSLAQARAQTDSGQISPFGYEHQRQKMMRPINDLLPQGAQDEVITASVGKSRQQ